MEYKRGQLMIPLDYPDPDVIRVGDTYYMISTTMHFLPGGEILRSRDLMHWEHAAFVFDKLDSTPAQRLEGEAQIYGKGMWAASIRHHEGIFYVCFVCNDTGKTYLYKAAQIEGPWQKQTIEGFYHDCSLLFEDDHIYIVYGNTNIYLTELDETMSGPKKGGIDHKRIITEENPILGHEGSHLYKIGGKYYLFTIHSRPDRWFRTECCFIAERIDGPYREIEVFHDDMGFFDQGVAQGGIVDTPDGRWYAILFQDRGAAGRFPVLVPVTWDGEVPVFGENGAMPETFEVDAAAAPAGLLPLAGSDDFRYPDIQAADGLPEKRRDRREYGSYGLKSFWQFNHEPEEGYFRLDTGAGTWTVENHKICSGLAQAPNMITQRLTFPKCRLEVTVNASKLSCGDYAGLCALQYSYGLIALHREADRFKLVMLEYSEEKKAEIVREEIPVEEVLAGEMRLAMEADFTDMKDTIRFFRRDKGGNWIQFGADKKVKFDLKHFAGCRGGLVSYATKQKGGKAVFTDVCYIGNTGIYHSFEGIIFTVN